MDNLFTDTIETARRYARTCDPQTSKEAAKKIVKSGELNRQEQEVLSKIESRPGSAMKSFDFTTKEVAAWMTKYPYHKAYDICRKRFSGLARKGKIEVVWESCDYKRRDGCRVWRLK